MNEQKKEHKSTQQRFSNDHITVHSTQKPGCVFDMNVHIDNTATQACYEKAVKEIRKEVSLPGFRQGKVPKEMVLKHFSEKIDQRSRNLLLTTAFDEAVKLNGRPVFSKYSILKSEIKKYSPEEGSELNFTYEAAPKVPEINPKELNIKILEPKPVDSKDCQIMCKRYQFLASEKKDVTDRPVQKNDLVTIIMFEEDEERKETVTVDKDLIPNWLYNQILDMKIDEKKKIEVPTEGSKESPEVHMTVQSIQECELPTLDALAKIMGLSSASELEEKIHSTFERSAKIEAHERMRKHVKNELIKHYAFDLPQSLVEHETESRFRHFWQKINKENEQVDEAELRRSFLDEVKRYFTCFFLLEPIAKRLDITYTKEEIMNEFYHQTQNIPVEQSVLYPNLSEREVIDRLIGNMMIKHCLDYCLKESVGISSPETLIATPPSAESQQENS